MSVLLFLQGLRCPFLTNVFELIRMAGEETAALCVVIVMFLCFDKKAAWKTAFALMWSGLAVNSLKIIARVPRPWLRDTALKPLDSALKTATGYSWPSGHMQTSTAVYGTLAALSKRRAVKISLTLLFILVGVSRMYAGVHTPADVACGCLFALITVFIEQRFMAPLIDRGDPAPAACLMTGICALASVVLAVALEKAGLSEAAYVTDTAKMGGAAIGFAAGYYADAKYIKFEPSGGKIRKAVRAAFGLGLTLGVRVALKPLLAPLGIAGSALRYMLMVPCVLVITPLADRRFGGKLFGKN